jgi:hypothetical protein
MPPARSKNRVESIYISNSGPYLAAWWKWEFLRRNSVYRADYQRFVDSFGAWFKRNGYWHELEHRHANWSKAEEAYFRGKIEPALIKLCRKWQVFDLFPPDWSFKKAHATGKMGTRELYPPTASPAASISDYRLGRVSRGTRRTGRSPAQRDKNLLT